MSTRNTREENSEPDAPSKWTSNVIESDHEDGQTQSSVSEASPTHSNTSKNSRVEDIDMEVKSPQDKVEPTLKRARKTYRWIRTTVNRDLWKNGNKNLGDKCNFSLKISNLPTNWGLDEIKDVIVQHCGPVNYLFMAANDDMCFIGMVKLEYVTFRDCQKAWENLHGRTVEEIKLFAEIRDLDEESDEDDEATPAKKKRLNQAPWRPDIDISDVDPKGLYGFTPEYLRSLRIKPPIDRWVHVTNFRCDKSELKEVMELAGQVLICTVDTKSQKLGKVMYSHPLEAVQAVSVLNNQQFYGQPLKVTMERCPVGTIFLPKGLLEVGPGLGAEGKVLRDVVKQYERFVKFKSSFLNEEIFRNPELLFASGADESDIYIPKKLQDLRNGNNNLNSIKQSNLDRIRTKSLSPGFRNNSPTNQERIPSPTSIRGPGQMGGSVPLKSRGPICGSGPMGNQGPMGDQGSMGGPGGLGPMGNQGSMGGPGGPGPMGNRSMGGFGGSIGSQGPMGNQGPMCGPGLMGNQGPGPMMGNQRPMSGPGPMMGNQGPIVGPGPMMGNPGPIGGPGPMMGNQGPIGGPGPMMGNQRPIGGPGPMSNQGLIGGGPIGNRGPMGIGPMGNQGGPIESQSFMGGVGSGSMGVLRPSGAVFGNGPQNAMPHPMASRSSRTPDNNLAVELCNLPLSTTFSLLCEKMSECGKVMSLQLTTPGCAVVQFAQEQQAEACFRQYNNRCILGNLIEVKYL